MKTQRIKVNHVVSAIVLAVAVFCLPHPSHAQSQAEPETRQVPKTFTGTIVRSNGKFILKDTLSGTSYQLDDQQKAQSFTNKNVKVTGILDPSTGTIRVTAIDPI